MFHIFLYTVKPLNSRHLRVLKNLSVIKRCPLLGGCLIVILTFGTKHFVCYSRHVRYLGCPLLRGFTVDGIFKTQKLPGGTFFIKSCNHVFMTCISVFTNCSSEKWYVRTKTVSDTYYINNDYTNTIKVYEDYIEFRTGRKSAERQKN